MPRRGTSIEFGIVDQLLIAISMDVVNVDEAITQVSKDISVALRDKQHEAIRSFCTAIFVSLPTGYGKTLIFAMLPLVFDKLKGRLCNTM